MSLRGGSALTPNAATVNTIMIAPNTPSPQEEGDPEVQHERGDDPEAPRDARPYEHRIPELHDERRPPHERRDPRVITEPREIELLILGQHERSPHRVSVPPLLAGGLLEAARQINEAEVDLHDAEREARRRRGA
jgi:hypothetical protein